MRALARLNLQAAAAGRHNKPALPTSFKSRRRHVQTTRAEGISWLDASSSSAVRNDYDAVIVLAGGLTPQGGLPPWVSRRLDAAADIQQRQQTPAKLLCLGGGTPHKPAVLGPSGHVIHEASACASYLMAARGVPAGDLLKEVSSYDTVGNGFFALTIHAIPAGWRRCSVITSAFHMLRSRAIFQTCFALAGASLWGDGGHFEVDFHAVHDEGIFAEDVLKARLLKEEAALATWRSDTAAFSSLSELHAWMHASHLCYSVSRQEDFGKLQAADVTFAKALASY